MTMGRATRLARKLAEINELRKRATGSAVGKAALGVLCDKLEREALTASRKRRRKTQPRSAAGTFLQQQ